MKKIFSFIIIICTIALSSCMKETFPTEFALESQIAESSTAMESLVSALPTTMIGWGDERSGLEECGYAGLSIAFEDMLQDVVIAGTPGFNTWSTYATMSNPVHARQNYAWYLYYAYIKNANAVIGMIDKDTQNETEQHYLGIAYTFRAFYYLNLVRMFEYKYTEYCPPTNNAVYGLGVPIVTEETTEEQAKNNPRVTVEENYEMIFADLALAEKYLDDYDPPSKAYPSLACIYGLYARAYLERGTAGVSGAYEKAAEYARRSINASGCTPLTQEQWQDSDNGFNNANSQNSWMWGVLISPDNTSMFSWSYDALNVTEQTWIVYGWRVGRSASRKFYEAIPDNDFRKYSWLDPAFFNEVDKDGNVIRAGVNSYNGQEYKLTMPADYIRKEQITVANGFVGLPWAYPCIKFRPNEGNYSDRNIGTAMDYPIMRIEEMYLIEAEAVARTQGLSQGINLLNSFMAYRFMYGTYDCASKCSDVASLVDEIIFQKRVEFWGEGIVYYDSKRLELGLHRGYKGINSSAYQNTFDIDGIHPIWNCRIPDTEKQGNPAMIQNPTPSTATALGLFWAKDNTVLLQYYGCDLNNPDGE